MAQHIFRLLLTDEAQDFIESLPEAVSYKIYYNIKRVASGERNKELFKKLENSEIISRTNKYGTDKPYSIG